jgi:hypothetical protein
MGCGNPEFRGGNPLPLSPCVFHLLQQVLLRIEVPLAIHDQEILTSNVGTPNIEFRRGELRRRLQ